MLPDIPTRAWIILAIAVIAVAPARYIYRHLTHSPRRRDITLPPEDLSWRSERTLALSALSLAGLAALAGFIFTPAAEALARSPQLPTLLAGGLGLFSLWTVVRGHIRGVIEPMVRGPSWEFRRADQPKRYWASMAWNALLGWGMLFVAYAMIASVDRDRCFADDDDIPPAERIAGCDAALADASLSESGRANLLTARAWNQEQAGDTARALADYDRALAADNTNPEAFYYRGMLHESLGHEQLANEDYNSAILLDPDDARVRLTRGVFYLNQGNLRGALEDLNRADSLKPGDVWILANRGAVQAWLENLAAARRDLNAARAIDSRNEVVLAGDAIVSFQEGNAPSAARQLDALLEIYPDNRWATDFRAEVVAGTDRSDRAPE